MLEGFDIRNFQVTDSSGQWFRSTRGGGQRGKGIYSASTSTAPWSDDLCWKVRFQVSRADHFSRATDEEKFVFDHLPVPDGNEVEVNRTITKRAMGSACDFRSVFTENHDWRFASKAGSLGTRKTAGS